MGSSDSRIALLVEYNGQRFSGWQAQASLRTAQGELEKALSKIAGAPITVFCAGRTDRGVHATGQVVHFDTQAVRPLHGWLLGANTYLNEDLVIKAIKQVETSFHARFSAIKRRYRYIIANQPRRSAIHAGLVTWYHRSLDEERMHRAAQTLVGTHDFNALRASGCQAKSPIRTLHEIRVWREGSQVLIEVTANAFLHHMVRNIVGLLLAIGSHDQPIDWVKTVLASKDRNCAGITAPPDGLYLTDIFYKEQVFP